LLQHEQEYGDITGLIAREAHQAYEQLWARTKYDNETNHGVDRAA
jgi:hypothetical protein